MTRWQLAVLVSLLPTLSAQTVTGTVSGVVTDNQDAVISSASVRLVNERTRERRETTTSDSGTFTFPAVQPGMYAIQVEQAGFRSFERNGNVVAANERLNVGAIKLDVGAVIEKVTVTAQGASVQSESAEKSALLTTKQLETISTKGRDVVSYLRVLPGVSYQVDAESVGGNFGTSTPNISGVRNGNNSFTIDGVTGNNAAAQNVFSSTINLDAIGEVKVLINSYQAEYGRNGGAIVNVVTKSGSSEYHGSGYWFKRHEQFNANNFFNNRDGRARPLYRYSTLGATLGGPLPVGKLVPALENKLFFFYSFENSQTREPRPLQQVTVPTELERRGDFSQTLDLNGRPIIVNDPARNGAPFPANTIPANRVNGGGQAVLAVLPAPNFLNRDISRGAYNYLYQESIKVPKTQHLFRVDFQPTSRDSLYVRGLTWHADTQGSNVPAGASTWGLLQQHYDFYDDGISLSYTRTIGPSLVNEFSAGARHTFEQGPPLSDAELRKVTRGARNIAFGQYAQEINPLNIIPRATFGGVPSAANITFDNRWPLIGADATFNVTNGLSYVRQGHTLKAGVFLERARNHEGPAGVFNGNLDFSRDVNNPGDSNYAYSNALLGNFRSYNESTTRPAVEGRVFTAQWYAQDTWKVNRRLTLDYGIRFGLATRWRQKGGKSASFTTERYDGSKTPRLYESVRVPAGVRARNPLNGDILPAVLIGAFVPNSGDIVNGIVLGTDATYPVGFRERDRVLAEPRFGLAYDILGDGKTVFRLGGGMFHQSLPGGGLNLRVTQTPPVQFNPTLFYGNLDTFRGTSGVLFPSAVDGVEKRALTPGTYNLNAGVQRMVGFGTVVDVSYVGSLGRHLEQTRNLNTVPYGARFLPRNADPANPALPLNENFYRPLPGYANVTWREFASGSNYHSLQMSANRRFIKSLQFGVAYTWSKSMDYTSSDGGAVALYRPIRIWNYGKSTFDQTHIFVANYTWDLPKASRLWSNAATRLALDNWQVSGITSFVSGAPSGVDFSTVDNADITGGGDGARVIVTGRAQAENPTFSRWFNPDAFARPARGDFGNAPKDVYRGPGISNWDISFFKNVPIAGDRRRLQFRWDMYNTFNHTQFLGVDSTARFDAAGRQVNQRFGEVISARGARVMQGSLRFSF